MERTFSVWSDRNIRDQLWRWSNCDRSGHFGGVWHLQTADRRPQTADRRLLACSRLRDGGGKSFSNKKCEKRCHRPLSESLAQATDCRLHEAAWLWIEWNQKYRNKGGVIINITLFRKVRPRSEVYIFHANYTDLIPKGAVGCSFRIELEQNNVCRCHKLAHESIATV